MRSENKCWIACDECKGQGKKRRRLNKKARIHFQNKLDEFEKTGREGEPPIRPKASLYSCKVCLGTGIITSNTYLIPDKENYPHIAIIGGGIGGVALAVACLHRGIPFTLYERDSSFDSRSQGYGLTLQQASRAMSSFGILALDKGIVSTKHIVHTSEGEVIGEWGMRKWLQSEEKKTSKRTNIHIARQSLRLALLEQLEGDVVQWDHQLTDFEKSESNQVNLKFLVEGEIKNVKADLVIGADGIRSTVRSLLLGENNFPLQYLGCIVILGICPLKDLEGLDSPLLDSATAFQTANGNERIYMMPYDSESIMWQLSFPISEKEAKILSEKGIEALKEEACRRTQWHNPIPQIMEATPVSNISGYPVYDRELLDSEILNKCGIVSLIGDAAHPMSPFKGQGANQALLDALELARKITIGCRPLSKWRDLGIRKSVLTDFESEMLARTASKVRDSATASELLHSDNVLRKCDEPRGRSKR